MFKAGDRVKVKETPTLSPKVWYREGTVICTNYCLQYPIQVILDWDESGLGRYTEEELEVLNV